MATNVTNIAAGDADFSAEYIYIDTSYNDWNYMRIGITESYLC